MAKKGSLEEFALLATERLRGIADELRQMPGVKYDGSRTFAGTLAGALLRVNGVLRTLPPSSHSGLRREQGLVGLLTELEILCAWPTPPSTQPVTIRRAGSLEIPPNQRFPQLAMLSFENKRRIAREKISRFAQDEKGPSGDGSPLDRQQRLIQGLGTFSPIKRVNKFEIGLDAAETGSNQLDAILEDDHSQTIRRLYNALCDSCFCLGTRIVTKLRLSIERSNETTHPTFNVLFVLHPHDDKSKNGWQVTTISVAPISQENGLCAGGKRKHNETLDATSFCPGVCKRRQLLPLRLLLNDGSLALQPQPDQGTTKYWVTTRPSVTLAEVITQHTIEPPASYLLIALLAKALWQFYDTEWMQIPWDVNSVFFLFERHGQDHGVFLNEPFIQTRFEPVPPGTPTEAPRTMERLASIRAFGVMLLEIELRLLMRAEVEKLSECADATDLDEQSKQIYAAQVIVDGKDVRMDRVPLPLKNVIGNCLKPDQMQAYSDEPAALRLAIHENIVVPLVGMLRHWYGRPEAIVLRQPTVLAEEPRTMALRPRDDPASLFSRLMVIEPVRSTSSASATASAAWFTDLANLHGVLQARRGDTLPNQTPVTIAILDTGLDPSCKYALAGYRDFVDSGSTQKIDRTGHGTRAVNLVFKVFGQGKLDVFVGRVFRISDADDNTRDLMEQGIRWAREECKANIITMASGFAQEHDGMKKEIKISVADDILVFAAASNYGNMRRVTFPGRMKHQVFCIYSTDGHGKIAGKSNSINPPERLGSTNFAILGEDISLKDPGDESRLFTGTSYATSIAAALAARIIDFSRQREPSQLIRKANELRTFEGMEAVLLRLSRPTQLSGPGGYNCIVPFSLIETFSDTDDLDRGEKRKRVCAIISDALESKYV